MTRRSVLWPVAAFVFAVSVPPVAALAEDASVLVSSSPAASTNVAEPPGRVEMVFASAVRPGSVRVVLLDAGRRETAVPAPRVSPDGTSVEVGPLPRLDDGTWVVTWAVTIDGTGTAHEGSFPFQVGEADERTDDQLEQILSALRTDSDLGGALWAVRILAWLAAIVLAGSVLVVRSADRSVAPRTSMIRMLALLVLVAGSAAVLLLRGAHAAGLSWGSILDASLLRDTLTTRVGVAAFVSVFLAVGWLVVVGTTRVDPPRRWRVASIVLAVVTLAVAALGAPWPGAGDGADARRSFGASLVAGDVVAEIALLPAVAGTAEVHVYLSPPGGMLAPAEWVTMSMSSPGLGLGAMPVTLVEAGPNHWSGVVLVPYGGRWSLDIVSLSAEGETSRFSTVADVTD